MTKNETDVRRILLAISEENSLHELWQAVTENLTGKEGELVILFVRDDRWRRAASLPFTIEISRVGGARKDFTQTRAEQIDEEAVVQTQDRLQRLAAEAKLRFAFEIVAEDESTRIHELVTSESDLLIAPSFFRWRPIYNEIARLKCRTVLINTQDTDDSPAETGET